MTRLNRALSLIAMAVLLFAAGRTLAAEPFAQLRVGIGGSVVTLDPHAANVGSTTTVVRALYEPLVGRGKNMEKIPALAVSWSMLAPDHWRFVLRQGVRFHDGEPLTPEDVIFSIQRAQNPLSDFRIYAQQIERVVKVDDRTVDILTFGPSPVLVDELTRIFIMNRHWALAHDVARPIGPRSGNFTATHENGTGPFRLGSIDPGGNVSMTRFAGWWGGAGHGNVDALDYKYLPDEGSRVAALLAGDVNLLMDVPPQFVGAIRARPGLKLQAIPENRTIYLGFDQARHELLYSNVRGRNPFMDHRVREAVYRAIDENAIVAKVLDGFAAPTGSMVAPSVFGYTKANDVRLGFDPARARALLAEAGYPNGFRVTLDCPTDRYVADRAICEAVAAMLARVGVTTTVDPLPFAVLYPKIRRRDTSFYLLGWGPPTFDAMLTLEALLHSPTSDGVAGSFNFGGYHDPALDSLIERLRGESDPQARLAMMAKALRIQNDDIGHVPLHNQMIIWAMRANIEATMFADNQLDPNLVVIKRQVGAE